MADNERDCLSLSEFLKFADLFSYEFKLKAAGISKIDHLQDVDSSDLKERGEVCYL